MAVYGNLLLDIGNRAVSYPDEIVLRLQDTEHSVKIIMTNRDLNPLSAGGCSASFHHL
jgi:hypothetical protein